jgi:CRP-like cAMP-binding protein
MFCNLNAEALADFGSIGVQATLPKGRKLFQEDEPSNGVYVICTGQVKLSCTSKEGRTLILKIAMPGDVLGLGAVISGSSYEVTAETSWFQALCQKTTDPRSVRADRVSNVSQCSWSRYAARASRSSVFRSTGVMPPLVMALLGV